MFWLLSPLESGKGTKEALLCKTADMAVTSALQRPIIEPLQEWCISVLFGPVVVLSMHSCLGQYYRRKRVREDDHLTSAFLLYWAERTQNIVRDVQRCLFLEKRWERLYTGREDQPRNVLGCAVSPKGRVIHWMNQCQRSALNTVLWMWQ